MAKNTSLHRAAVAKENEFYTQLSDIEREMRHYVDYFKQKIIFCNCDDPYESNFFKYFAMNFNHLKLKKLVATCYAGSPIQGEQLSLFDVTPISDNEVDDKQAYKIEISEVADYNEDGAIDLVDVEYLLKNKKNTLTLLEGDGDFRSAECIELLKQADIVATNPPFSLFREYVIQLMEYEKNFIIIGSKNAITYKEIFGLIREGRLWLGIGFQNGNAYFRIPDGNEHSFANGVYDETTGLVKFRNVGWYTNLDYAKRHENITLIRDYTPDNYPHFDNYDAISVDRVADIPRDWVGAMGVPITFLDKHNPEQFEVIGLDRYVKGNKTPNKRMTIDGKEKYARILIRRIGATQ